jgi:hypothetical protein
VHFATGNFLFTKTQPMAEAVSLWKVEKTKRE